MTTAPTPGLFGPLVDAAARLERIAESLGPPRKRRRRYADQVAVTLIGHEARLVRQIAAQQGISCAQVVRVAILALDTTLSQGDDWFGEFPDEE